MKQFFLFILFLKVFSCSGQNTNGLFEEANKDLSEKKYEKAISIFDTIIKKNPDFYNAYFRRCDAKYALKNYRSVIEDCFLLVSKPKVTNDVLSVAYWNIGTAYNSLMEYEKAKKYMKLAKNLDEKNYEIYENLSYSYMHLNQLDSALSELQSLIKINPNYPKGYYGIGKVKFLMKKYEESINYFDKAIELDSNYGIAFQNRGSAKLQIGDKNGACEDWNKSYSLGIVEIKQYIDEFCK